jgi:hypothetical protein
MSVPRDGTIRRVRSQSYPFITRTTKDTVGLELGDVWVRTEVLYTFLFCAFGTTTFRWGIGQRFGSTFWSINHRLRWVMRRLGTRRNKDVIIFLAVNRYYAPALQVGVPVFQSKTTSRRIFEGDTFAARCTFDLT